MGVERCDKGSALFHIIFLIFTQNIDCGYMVEVLTSTHNLCFGAKIRKIGMPLYTPLFYIKLGYEGVFIARTCFPDGNVLYSH